MSEGAFIYTNRKSPFAGGGGGGGVWIKWFYDKIKIKLVFALRLGCFPEHCD
jgi:hypothetical protein